MRRIFLTFLTYLFIAAPVYAQDLDNLFTPPEEQLSGPQSMAPEAGPAIAPNEDDLIPDEVFYEAKLFEQYCQSDQNFRLYYNCECLAARFLDERIEQGPKAQRTAIVEEIQDGCHDAVEAAAVQYNTCMGNALLLPRKLDANAYCTCYGNRFATIFEEQQIRVNPGNITRVQTQSHSECRKRGEAALFQQ